MLPEQCCAGTVAFRRTVFLFTMAASTHTRCGCSSPTLYDDEERLESTVLPPGNPRCLALVRIEANRYAERIDLGRPDGQEAI